MRIQTGLFILAGFLLVGAIHAQQVEFNYEGRVMVDGLPFDGQGHFKLAIVNKNGSLTLWSNDATSIAGEEPSGAVVVDVTEGVFNVIIGDASGTGMEPLEASLFNVEERVSLRVWFSDTGALGSFEALKPDRDIANPGLLGSQSYREMHLYVDSVLGDNKNPGLKPSRPKQTIQAAWNALPPLIREDATIHLAEGIYREEVLLTGKSVIGDATIIVLGNESDPSTVIVTGADEAAPTEPVRTYGFNVVAQARLAVRGLRFEYTKKDWQEGFYERGEKRGAGLYVDQGSNVSVAYCQFMNNDTGLWADNGSTVMAENIQCGAGTTGSYPRGVQVETSSRAILRDSSIHNMHWGVGVGILSNAQISGCTVSNNTGGGCAAAFNSVIEFLPPVNTISGNPSGVIAGINSVVMRANDPTRVTYSGNTSNTSTQSEGLFYE